MNDENEPWWPYLKPDEREDFQRVSRDMDTLRARFATRRTLRERARQRMKKAAAGALA